MTESDASTVNSDYPQQRQAPKLEKLFHIEQCLVKLTEFLNPYLPLANANVTEFITDDQWTCYLPTNIQQELLQLTEDQLQRLPLLNEDTHFSEGYSSETECPKRVKLLGNSCSWNHESLFDFLQEAHSCSLELMDILTPIAELKKRLHLNLEMNLFLPPTFMSEKKSHEVMVMSKVCDALCKQFGIETVVDLGSGKGYLGVHLADNHGLQVIGIDASAIHTLGAKKRASILKKHQPKMAKNSQQKLSNTQLPIANGQDFHKNDDALDKRKLSNKNDKRSDDVTDKLANSVSNKSNSKNGFYLPTAAFVDNDTNIMQLLSKEIDVSNLNGKLQVLVTGLHTCGNLCPTILRFFSGNPAASVLCNVACCYHLLEEEEEEEEKVDIDTSSRCGFPMSSFLRKRKFQLGRGARNLASQSIFRNMSSDQLQGNAFFQRALLQKIIQDTVDPKFHRSTEVSSKLRKLGSKCSSFLEYVTKAFGKLGFSCEHICDQLLSDFLTKYEDEKRKLAAFFQLKTVLAPSLEAIIILDRLYFLFEQATVSDAYICQLFDPLISPRCYGIIAYK